MNDSLFGFIGLVSGVATAVGVFFAAAQLRLSQQNETTRFEDEVAREFREIVQRIPTAAMLGEALEEVEYAKAFDELYRYFSLSNEQVFLWRNRRIRKRTWEHWRAGIKSHIERPAFRRAWSEIKAKLPANQFEGLRALEADEV
jgi:hypothetical protein